MHSVLLAGCGNAERGRDEACMMQVTQSRDLAFFFRVFKASDGKREASEERSKGSDSGCTHLLCQCQDGYQHFSRDTHNFPNFLSSPSTTPSDPFSAAQINTMELSPGERLRI